MVNKSNGMMSVTQIESLMRTSTDIDYIFSEISKCIITTKTNTRDEYYYLLYELLSKTNDIKIFNCTLKIIKNIENSFKNKILFLILETMIKERVNNYELYLEIYNNIKYDNGSINNHIISLLRINDSYNTVKEIIIHKNLYILEEILNGLETKDSTLTRNIANLIVEIAKIDINFFRNINIIEYIDHEEYFIRNAVVEILFYIIKNKKDINKNEDNESDNKKDINNDVDSTDSEDIPNEDNNYIEILLERSMDSNYLVRSKIMSVFRDLIEEDIIPSSIFNRVVEKVTDRIMDKTSIVRKKAVLFCTSILITHFKDKEYGEYNKNIGTVLSNCIKNIISTFSYFKSEIVSVIEYSKICYYYNINGSKDLIKTIIKYTIVQNDINTIKILVDNINELISKIGITRRIEFIEDIKDTGLLVLLVNKSVIDTEIIEKYIEEFIILSEILSRENNDNPDERITGMKVFNTIKEMLSNERNKIKTLNTTEEKDDDFSAENIKTRIALEILKTLENMKIKDSRIFYCSSDILFSTEESEINRRIEIYRRGLIGLEGEEELKKAIKDVVRMNFFEPLIMEIIVKEIYKTDIEKYVKYFFNILTKKKEKIKLIHLTGCVAINHSKYIDRIERKIKEGITENKDKNETENELSTSINKFIKNIKHKNISTTTHNILRERRKSINASRQSIRLSIYNEESIIIEEEMKIFSKGEEEVLDILFYIKEKEIIENGLLKEYIKIVIEGCHSNNIEIQTVSYTAIFRIMACSSTFFINNFQIFLNGITHKNKIIRHNSILAHSDFILLYNFIVEKYNYLLFDRLLDTDEEIILNTLYIIYYLVTSKIVKIKNNSIFISILYCESMADGHCANSKKNENNYKYGITAKNNINSICKKLLLELSKDNNTLLTIALETITSGRLSNKNITHIIELLKEHMKEKECKNLFLKALERGKIDEGVKGYLKELEKVLGIEKYVDEMREHEEYREYEKMIL